MNENLDGLTELERYCFDVQGFVVLRNLISKDAVDEMNQLIDENAELIGENDIVEYRFQDFLLWGQPFRDILDHSRVYAVLEEMLGEAFRLDHYYGFDMPSKDGVRGLHGGGDAFGDSFYAWRNGRMHNGLVAVVWALCNVPPGMGFVCVPGSHKANLSYPEELLELVPEVGVTPELHAGDALVFTEALTHATAPWHAPYNRRVLFYKYTPRYIAWGGARDLPGMGLGSTYSDWQPELYDVLTARQKALLAPPCVWPTLERLAQARG